MKRRTVLGGILTSTTALIATFAFGFSGRFSRVDGEELTLSPGHETTLTIEAYVARSLRFEQLPDEDGVSFDTSDAEIDPSPESVAESSPPIWYWFPPRLRVTIDVPIRVPSDAAPGEYLYAVSVSPTQDISSNVTTREFTITVR